MGCRHKTAADHSVMGDDRRRVWTCTNCGTASRWTDSWSYWGSLECTGKYGYGHGCGVAAIDWVACSPKCAKALQEAA